MAKSREWFYFRDGTPRGPFSSKEIRRLARSGTLVESDLLWRPGMERQRPAGESTNLWARGTQETQRGDEPDESGDIDGSHDTDTTHEAGSCVETAQPGRRSLRMVIGATLVGLGLLLSALLIVAGLSHQHSRATATTPPRAGPLPGRPAAPPAESREPVSVTEPPPADSEEVAVSAVAVAAVKPDAGPVAAVPDEENAATSVPVAPPPAPRPARLAGDDF